MDNRNEQNAEEKIAIALSNLQTQVGNLSEDINALSVQIKSLRNKNRQKSHRKSRLKNLLKILASCLKFFPLLLCGEVRIREVIRKIRIKLERCTSVEKVLRELWKVDAIYFEFTKIRTIEIADFSRVYSIKYANSTEIELTKHICKAANSNITGNKMPDHNIQEHIDKISTAWLEDMETLAIAGGMFVLAYEIRQCLIKKLKKIYPPGKKVRWFDIRRMYAMHMSVGDFENATQVLTKCNKIWKYRYRPLWNELYALTRPPSENALNATLDTLDLQSTDSDFLKLIKGKTVAVLGPAQGELDVQEVQDFDIKVRITFRGMGFLDETSQKLGVDVSYYNLMNARALNASGNVTFLRKLKMACFKIGIAWDWQKDLVLRGKARGMLGRSGVVQFKGSGNMLQNLLLDLFHFAPAKIKVFNMNLFLAKIGERYQSGYYALAEEQEQKLTSYTFVLHNLISNYEITKMWYDAGYFEADAQLTEILELGTHEYLARMESLYSGNFAE
ncbi:MAG: hypothetical protein FWG65_10490 [Turicibacter sp.]|nr:hypothetical protein [Turicibacter sp.]